MRVDIERLQAFYATPLGQAAQAMVARRVRALWPHAQGMDVLGYGHAEALIEPYLADARRVVSASPDAQGVARWPETGRNCAALVDEERLPFADAVFDRLIVRHGLEEAEGPRRLLREFWRIAAPEARLLIIVAHRRGLWARAESTPFGHGRPYTKTQLTRLLEECMFQPTASARALYAPPISWRVVTDAHEAWERAGRFAWARFGGVLMVEAVKRVHAAPRPAKALRRPVPVRAMKGAAAPARSPQAGFDGATGGATGVAGACKSGDEGPNRTS
jgi:SAM-dependent methyltransferase